MAIRPMTKAGLVLCVAIGTSTCAAPGLSNPAPQATLVVGTITTAACVTQPGGGVTCTLVISVGLNNATLTSGSVTMITTGLLVGQWTTVTPATNRSWNFPNTTLVHKGVACVSPQTTLALYDGLTYDTSPLVASTPIGPITFSCR